MAKTEQAKGENAMLEEENITKEEKENEATENVGMGIEIPAAGEDFEADEPRVDELDTDDNLDITDIESEPEEEVDKIAKAVKEDEKKEKKRGLVKTILAIVALAAIAVAIISMCSFSKNRLSDAEKKTIQNNTAKVGTALYGILLEGKHTATCSNGQKYEFNFTNGLFDGHTSLKENDMGTYEVRYNEQNKPILMISGEVVMDEYYIETDGEKVTLTDTVTGDVYTFLI